MGSQRHFLNEALQDEEPGSGTIVCGTLLGCPFNCTFRDKCNDPIRVLHIGPFIAPTHSHNCGCTHLIHCTHSACTIGQPTHPFTAAGVGTMNQFILHTMEYFVQPMTVKAVDTMAPLCLYTIGHSVHPFIVQLWMQ